MILRFPLPFIHQEKLWWIGQWVTSISWICFEKATEKIKDSQIQQKETYDRNHVTEELSVGTSVLLENLAQKGRKGGKLQELFRGNYTISENLGKGLYRLKNDYGKILKNKINIKRLKVCRKRGEIYCSRNETDTKKAKVIVQLYLENCNFYNLVYCICADV